MTTTSQPVDNALGASQTSGTGAQPPESLSPLEQEVLDEYARLVGNLNNLSTLLSELSTNPSAEILDALRRLERKTSLVFTLLKSSVYSIVMNQQAFSGAESDGGYGGAVGQMAGFGVEDGRQ
ncbi:hypothetical protein EJ05DRAFT_496850 [Pseudovirgaria hyperparasitica]|uniref:DASH complex subunit DAD3 n=1 Tax=Pseudovirgaria hyperparasitica TaxID=470096 RepID=A0A6A6WIA1_9PEZI|nr:uncharacterized protein EJ05DRAFT_496850 [Pseudovirgaria hyperparasitica]KAF2761969.1 hypothetical protein EJ05DRAFT_496850 [Pseudovirgaria hyperparasitica]